MRRALLTAVFALFLPSMAFALPVIGEPAPAFSLKDTEDRTVSLDKLKGKIVVLEWNNPTCPFVHKHYDSGNMQKLQAEATSKDVVWITVNSGSPGKVGTIDAPQARSYIQKNSLSSSHYILDTDGYLGRLYGAKTTPHMFVIDKDGKLAYMGAIDSDSNINPAVIATADNYVRDAINALNNGTPLKITSTQSYGCGVKYAE